MRIIFSGFAIVIGAFAESMVEFGHPGSMITNLGDAF
jgi:hypothetical protein